MEKMKPAKIVKTFIVTSLEKNLILSPVQFSKVPGRCSVAPFTNCEIITAERTLAIVTSQATLRATGRVVIERLRRGDLSSLRQAGTHLMTFVASHFLMLRMAEADFECRRKFRRARIATQLMTSATRRNVAAAGLRARSVASIAGCVRIETRGNCEGHATARRAMTRRATNASHLQMQGVIELHAKALQARKRFQSSRLHVRVANSANRAFGICELLRMTTGARQVTRRARTSRNRRVGIALVTQQAW